MLRYPRVLGAILLASAALILIKGTIFVTGMSVAEGGTLLARLYGDADVSGGLWESLWISLIAFIMLGALTAVVVGLMSLFQARPAQALGRFRQSLDFHAQADQAARHPALSSGQTGGGPAPPVGRRDHRVGTVFRRGAVVVCARRLS